MSDVSIGTVSSQVRLNLSNLQNDVSEAKSALASLAASLAGAVETFSAKMAQDAEAAVAREERAAQAAVERAARAAKAQQQETIAAANKVGGALQTAGLMAVGALGMAVKTGADFEQKLITVANNTTMTTADIAAMGDAVKSLGRESGADLGQLSDGFMHASNFGFSAAESTQILTEAMKSAVSTGSDVGKTTEILANVMHEFSIQSGDASKAMNVLHLAAAQGNATLEQFVEAGGPAFAMAANLGVGMTETAAAMSALTKHGFTAAEAATQVRNILSHIAEPAKRTRDLLAELSKTTGVDLVKDFSLAGLQGKGMAGILDDIKTAAGKANISTSDLMMKLVPAMRGGVGAMALAGTAAKDFKAELLSLNDAMSGKVDPTMTAYERQQASLTAQTNKARNELTLMSSDIEKALMPALRGMIGGVSSAAKWFQDLSPTAKNATVQIVAFAGAAALVTGTVLKTITALAELKAAMSVLGGTGGLAASAAGVAGLAARVANPVTLTAGMMLMTTNTGNGQLAQREVATARIEDQVRRAAKSLAEWKALSSEARLEYVKSVYGTNIFGAPVKGRDEYDAELKASLKAGMDALGRRNRAAVGGHAGGTGGSNLGNVDLNKWMADHDTGGGGSGGGGKSTSDSADELKRHLEEAVKATADVQDKLFELSHTDVETKMRQAWKDTVEAIGEGVPKMQAYLLYYRQVDALEKQTQAKKDAADNEAITGRLHTMIEGLKQEALELQGVQDAADAAEASLQQMFDNQVKGIFDVIRGTEEETAAMKAHYDEVAADAEAAWHAQVNASIEAAKGEREELEQTEQYRRDNPDVFKKKKTDLDNALKQMGGSVESILGGAFEKLFTGDTKNWFGDLLKAFEQMLAKMVAEALAAGIVRSLFGGGNFVTGFMGSIMGGGFDDAGNDRWAVHQGFDFASKFAEGMQYHGNSRMAMAGAGGYGGGGDTHNVTVHVHNPAVRSEMDIRELSRQVAREVRNTLPVRPGTGYRR